MAATPGKGPVVLTAVFPGWDSVVARLLFGGARINVSLLTTTMKNAAIKIKERIGIGLVWGVSTLGSVALANSIVLNQTSYSYGGGGEFRAVTSAPELLNGYAPAAIVNGGFETFCMQASVHFSPGTAYSFTLSNTDSQGRALSLGAAFLYQQFATGTLLGYDYNNAANRRNSAGLLQAAFWELQGNQTGGSGYPGGGIGNAFYDYAATSLGGGNLTLANEGTYNVAILQMWDAAGGTHQNQLVLNSNPPRPPVPQVPEGGATVVLLAMGAAGLALGKILLRQSPSKN